MKPSDVVWSKLVPVTIAPVRFAFVSLEYPKNGVGEVLPAEVPAGEVIIPSPIPLRFFS